MVQRFCNPSNRPGVALKIETSHHGQKTILNKRIAGAKSQPVKTKSGIQPIATGKQKKKGLNDVPKYQNDCSVTTLGGEQVSSERIVISGRVSAPFQTGKYFFEYGFAKDELVHKTEDVFFPGPISSKWTVVPFRDDKYISNTYLQKTFHQNNKNFIKLAIPEFNKKAKFSKINGYDSKHVGHFPPFLFLYNFFFGDFGVKDLRDAILSITLRDRGGLKKSCTLMVDVCKRQDTGIRKEKSKSESKKTATWVNSGSCIDSDSVDRDWQDLYVRFSGEPEKWSFGGNNRNDKGWAEPSGYGYVPLNRTLSRANLAVHLYAMYPTRDKLPAGSLDIRKFSLTHRNNSLVYPGNRARIEKWPLAAKCDPDILVNGSYGTEDDCFFCEKRTGAENSFKFVLYEEITIERMNLLQHPIYPAREVSLKLFSMDDILIDKIVVEMMSPDKDTYQPLTAWKHERVYKNIGKIELCLKKGFCEEYIGLAGFEVYSDAASKFLCQTPLTVSEDLENLAGYESVYYRLVSKIDGVRIEGSTENLQLRKKRIPYILTSRVIYFGTDFIKINVRFSPNGSDAFISVEYKNGNDSIMRTEPLPVGYLETCRDCHLFLKNLKAGIQYQYRIILFNCRKVVKSDWASFKLMAVNSEISN